MLDGVFAVLGAVDHAESEEEDRQWDDYAEAEADAPDTGAGSLVVGCEDDESYDTGDHEAEINSEIGGHGN